MAKREKLKAFVISPIGRPGAKENHHAEWVFNELIAPACKRLAPGFDVQPIRADHEYESGRVMARVVDRIIRYPVIFAVLAFERPNVYYELALAHAAARNIVMLRSRDEPEHFDLKGINEIRYEYKEGQPANDHEIEQVKTCLEQCLAAGSHQERAFDHYDPFGRHFREYRFFNEFRDLAVREPKGDDVVKKNLVYYSDYFLNAEEFLCMAGISLKHFASPTFDYVQRNGDPATFPDVVQYLTTVKGVDVRLVMLHPDNPTLPSMISYKGSAVFEDDVESVREECEASFRAWSRIARRIADLKGDPNVRRGSIEIVQLRHGPMRYRLTMTDKTLLMTPYFNHLKFNGHSPTLLVESTSDWYKAIRGDLDAVLRDDLRGTEPEPTPSTGAPEAGGRTAASRR